MSAGTVTFDLRGIAELQDGLKNLSAETERKVEAAVRTHSELVMAASQRQVPRGLPYPNLVNTKRVTVKQTPDGVIMGVLEYLASYAIYVHEINANYRVGKWHYLGDPLREMAPQYIADLSAQLGVIYGAR